MTVSINTVIPVNSNALSVGSTGAGFGGLCLTSNPLIPTSVPVLQFDDLATVGDFFGVDSNEYLYAQYYFSGFTIALKNPSYLLYSLYINSALAPYIRSSEITAPLATFKQVSAGTLTLNFNGLAVPLTNISLTSATSFSAIAAIIQTALIATIPLATCVYDSVTSAFQISNGDISGSGSVTYAANSQLATLMQLTSSTGAILSQGSPMLSPTENMANVINFAPNWAAFTNLVNLTHDEQLELCKWVNSTQSGYSYVPYTTETINGTTLPNTVALVQAITVADYANVIQVFGGNPNSPNVSLPIQGLDQAMFVLGIGASIAWDLPNSTINFAFKQQTGLMYTVNDDALAAALIKLNVNFYGNYASRANTYRFFQQGRITGQFKLIGNFYNQLWLSTECQDAMATLFENSGKVENGTDGYTLLTTVLDTVMDGALNNNVAQKGNTFSASQAAIIKQRYGVDLTGVLENKGYFILLIPPTPEQKVKFQPPSVTIIYTNQGVILTLPLNLTFIF